MARIIAIQKKQYHNLITMKRDLIIYILLVAIVALVVIQFSPELKRFGARVKTVFVSSEKESSLANETPSKEEAPPKKGPDENNGIAGSVVLDPKNNDVFRMGKSMLIRWNRNMIDVSTIDLIKVPDDPSAKPPSFRIYWREDIKDEVTVNGYYIYHIPSDLPWFEPGKYRVRLNTYGEKVSVVGNETFTIISPLQPVSISGQGLYIGNITPLEFKIGYTPGSRASYYVEAKESDGSSANDLNGFRITAEVSSGNNGSLLSSAVGAYDNISNSWILPIDVPSIPGFHKVTVRLHCSDAFPYSYCARKYEKDLVEKDFVISSEYTEYRP